jgi:DNA invertase Pin-like site-specific DNA recombinase
MLLGLTGLGIARDTFRLFGGLDPFGELARSIRDLLHLLDEIKAAGARFRALEDPWCDTTTPHGELILTVMGGLYEFERKLIRQRCDEGIKRAKAKGTKFGRTSVLDAGQRRKIAERYANGETMAELARDYDCGEATIWRALHPANG